MKTLFFLNLLAASLLVACGDKSNETSKGQDEATEKGDKVYALDAAASALNWEGSKVTGKHTGTVTLKAGELKFTDGKLVDGKFEIDMASIVASDMDEEVNGKLVGHLKSPDFFDVEKNPTAVLDITSVSEEGGSTNIKGNLTIKGQTHEVSFPATITKNGNQVEASGELTIDRTLWGINYEGKKDDLISKEVKFSVKVVAKAA